MQHPSDLSNALRLASLCSTPGQDQDALVSAYISRIAESRQFFWSVEGQWQGHRAVVARIHNVYVLGARTGFTCVGLNKPVAAPTGQSEFIEAAEAIIRGSDIVGTVYLSSYTAWAHQIAKDIAQIDYKRFFASIDDDIDSSPPSITSGKIEARKYRYLFGHRKHYLRRIGATLKALRQILPDDVRKLMWSVNVTDVKLANWLMSEHGNFRYRVQAVHAQPFLLPLAIIAERSWMGPRDRSVHEQQRALNEAIDHGAAWHEPLCAVLNEMGMDCYKFSPSTVSWLARRPIRFSSLPWECTKLNSLAARLSYASQLTGNRQPRTRAQWKAFSSVIAIYRDIPERFLSGFLAGMPLEWTDPSYVHAHREFQSFLNDVFYRWVVPGPGDVYYIELARVATLKEIILFNRRSHEEIAAVQRIYMDASINATNQKMEWAPALQGPIKISATRQIVELTTKAALVLEGAALNHCVGQYSRYCFAGQCRILSVRSIENTPLSTVEITLNPSGTICVYQHESARIGKSSGTPSADCRDAVGRLLTGVRDGTIAFNADWPNVAAQASSFYDELYSSIRTAVQSLFARRWPRLAEDYVSPDRTHYYDR